MSRSYSGEAELTQRLNDTGRHSSRDANPKRSPINRQTLSSIARISAYSGTKYNMTIGLHASDDPLTQAMRPRLDETSAERTKRLREEEEALKRSKEIDELLVADGREKHQIDSKTVKVLLLGQAESGKSTTLKNFQLTFAPSQFHAERAAWKAVIQLNLITSVRIILDVLNSQLADDLSANPAQANVRHGMAENNNMGRSFGPPVPSSGTSDEQLSFSIASSQRAAASLTNLKSSVPSYIPPYNHNNASSSSVMTITSSQVKSSSDIRFDSTGTGGIRDQYNIKLETSNRSKFEKPSKEGKGGIGEGTGRATNSIISSLGGLGFGRDKDKDKDKLKGKNKEGEKEKAGDKELRKAGSKAKELTHNETFQKTTPLHSVSTSSLARARSAISANSKPSIYSSKSFLDQSRPRTQSSDCPDSSTQVNTSISLLTAEHRKLLLRLRALLHVEKQLAEALDMELSSDGDPNKYYYSQNMNGFRNKDYGRTPTSPTSSVHSSYSSSRCSSQSGSSASITQPSSTSSTPLSPRIGNSSCNPTTTEISRLNETHQVSAGNDLVNSRRATYTLGAQSEDELNEPSSKLPPPSQKHEFLSRAGDAWKRAIKQGKSKNDRESESFRDQEKGSEEEGIRERKISVVYTRPTRERNISRGDFSQRERESVKDGSQGESFSPGFLSRKCTSRIDTRLRKSKSKEVSSPISPTSPTTQRSNYNEFAPHRSPTTGPVYDPQQTLAERIYEGPLPILIPITKLEQESTRSNVDNPTLVDKAAFSKGVLGINSMGPSGLQQGQSGAPINTGATSGLRVRESVILEKKKREREIEKGTGREGIQNIAISKGNTTSKKDCVQEGESVPPENIIDTESTRNSSELMKNTENLTPEISLKAELSLPSKSLVGRGESRVRATGIVQNLVYGQSLESRFSIPQKSLVYTAESAAATVLAASAEDIISLWNDPLVRFVLQRRGVEVEWGSGFFLDDAARVTSLDFVPSDNDILKARIQTQGVEEHRIIMETTETGTFRGDLRKDWLIYDVSGSRGTRHKWIPYFENVDAIIFLSPLLFTQTLAEDHAVPRVVDSLQLFSDVVAHPLLARASIVLFLNKLDLAARAIKQGKQISDYLKGYPKDKKENNVGSLVKAFRVKFRTVYKTLSPQHRLFFCHETSVIDSAATSKILHSVREGIVYNNLHDANVL